MKYFDFTGKVAVITGAASGIGRATAEALVGRGCAVALFDRKRETIIAMADAWSENGKPAQAFAVDVSDADAVKDAVHQVDAAFGGINLLCHCAGMQSYGTAVSTGVEDWHKTLSVDMDSAFYLAKVVIPVMQRRGGGSIVLTGSTQSLVAHRNSAAYVTGKHALLGIMRSIALDFAKDNIRCNCVLPGAIDTPMIRRSINESADPESVLAACHGLAMMGRMGTPEEVASVNLFLLSDMAAYMTGSTVVVDGGQLVPCGGSIFQSTGTGGE